MAHASGDAILETEGLTKEFRGFVAVKDVALRVRRGTIHALIGPNGAGKTTCFNLLTKFLTPTRGRIVYNGRDITATKPAQIAQLGLVRSFQISAVFGHLTALENVRLALQRGRGELVRLLALRARAGPPTTAAPWSCSRPWAWPTSPTRPPSSCPTAASARSRSRPRSRSSRS